MEKSFGTVPLSDLEQDPAKVLKQVRDSNEPVIITEEDRPAAVMLSVEAFERSEHEREILLLFARGEREIAAGVGYDVDEVFAEAEKLLSEPVP
jgi:prevent-host-death family protein